MTTFAEYLASLPGESERDALLHAWELAAQAVPDAAEGTSYGVPALRLRRSPLFAVQARRDHLVAYPFSPAVLESLADRLSGFVRTKGSVRFTADHPLPDDVVGAMVTLRAEEIGHGPR